MSRFEVPVSELLKVILKLNSVLQISTIDGNRIGSDLTDLSAEARTDRLMRRERLTYERRLRYE